MNALLCKIITFRWRRYKKIGKNSVIYPPKLTGKYMNHVSVGEDTQILPFSRIQCFPEDDQHTQIEIGSHCMFGYFTTILCGGDATVKIGDHVLMASHILITAENHGMDPSLDLSYREQPLEGKSISIGDGCWIGEKVIILPGVKIGEKAIIGAGSVVTKDIPPCTIAVGNPARVVKRWNSLEKCWETWSE